MAWEKADLLTTDPPYGVKYRDRGEGGEGAFEPIENDDLDPAALRAFLDRVLMNAARHMRPGASGYVCHANLKPGIYGAFEGAFLAAGFQLGSIIVWVKRADPEQGIPRPMTGADYASVYEPILFGWLEGGERVRVADRKETNVWDIAREPSATYIHPTQKPVDLIARMLRNSSREGDNVLELFSGSGSTLVACEKLKRRCFAMEKSPAYVDAALARWERLTGQRATLEAQPA
jgi:DNA modification methylase